MANYQYYLNADERWDNIAIKAYGSLTIVIDSMGNTVSAIETIVEANPEVLIIPVVPAGTVLNIPIITDDQQIIDTALLPPWG